MTEELTQAQHTDPWIGKTQKVRLENVVFGGPMMIRFGLTGRLGMISRGFALWKAPKVFSNNLSNFRRLERERRSLGRDMPFWQDKEAARAQAFRVIDFAVLAPIIAIAAISPKTMNRKWFRSFAFVAGAITIMYNLDNYLGNVEEAKKKVMALLNEENWGGGREEAGSGPGTGTGEPADAYTV